jgi:uncharacterized membrane protein
MLDTGCRMPDTLAANMAIARVCLLYLAAVFFIAAGMGHFVRPGFYERMMPPYLPWPAGLIFISGVAEVAGGAGLLLRRWRRAAGWGLLALLIAVFPANVYMLQHPEAFNIPVWVLWARLPFQGVFMAWVWWVALKT